MLNVEQAIREVAAVYQAITGRVIEAGSSELPATDDPKALVEQRYLQLKTIIDSPAASASPVWSPLADIVEIEREVRYDIDLPAVSRQQVSVSVAGDHVLVRGQRAAGAPASAVRRAERPAGPFQKVLPLPPRARPDGITAVLRDGVLSIAIPLDGSGEDTISLAIDVK